MIKLYKYNTEDPDSQSKIRDPGIPFRILTHNNCPQIIPAKIPKFEVGIIYTREFPIFTLLVLARFPRV